MNKEYKEKFPQWIKDDKKYYMYMCMSDDLDSLFSCILLQKLKNYEVSHFYSFNKLYKNDNYKNNEKSIGVDMDLVKGKCWSNHVTAERNSNAANLNILDNVNKNTYFKKYAGSTLLEIISCYNYNISNLSEEAKMVLLCIDSTYMGFYLKQYPLPQASNRHYLCDILELGELYKVEQRHTRQEFEQLQQKYNLKKKIFINEDGELKTGIDLENLSILFDLPLTLNKDRFTAVKTFSNTKVNVNAYTYFVKKLEKEGYTVFSEAMTRKDFVKLSYN